MSVLPRYCGHYTYKFQRKELEAREPTPDKTIRSLEENVQMGEASDQIERHIQETRNDLSENLSELEEKVKTAVDWRAQFEERPMTMMALAFGGGLLLSAVLPSARSSRRRYAEDRGTAPPDRESTALGCRHSMDCREANAEKRLVLEDLNPHDARVGSFDSGSARCLCSAEQ
jgi:hypothetical protein